jgi:hypothetical protein
MSKRRFVAAGLQCVPLLLAAIWAGELIRGWFRFGGDFLYFWLLLFSWGLGNLYLRQWSRFLTTWVAGFAATAVAGLASLALVMRCGPTLGPKCPGFVSPAPLVLVVVGGALARAVDAWRMASTQNALGVARRRRRIRR